MDPERRRLLTPSPAEIIRSAQKDEYFIQNLAQDVEDVCLSTLGQRFLHRWDVTVRKAAKLAYYACTNGSGFQSLGEEYCGLIQVNQSATTTPGKTRIAMMVLLGMLDYGTLGTLVKTLEKKLTQVQKRRKAGRIVAKEHEDHSSPTVQFAFTSFRIFKHYLPFLGQLHLAIFFVQGTFYEFSKRILGIYYLLYKQSIGGEDVSTRSILKYLMWISVMNSVLTCVQDSLFLVKNWSVKPDNLQESVSTEANGIPDTGRRCTLCLEQRKNVGVTPCGHLFCWECIIDWLLKKQECPVCRDNFSPSRVVPLQNYT